MPVTIDALLGEHTPDTEYTLVYLTPSSAKRDRFGVLIVESPNGGIYKPKSSATSQTILNLFTDSFGALQLIINREKSDMLLFIIFIIS